MAAKEKGTEHEETGAIPAPETYGTFKIDSIHGRLLELEAYLEVARERCRTYFVYVVVASLLWPIAWLLALYTGKRAQETEQKTLAMATMILYLGTLFGVILWTLPVVLVIVDGGFSHFLELIEHEVLSMVDMSEFMFSELILLLFVQFCWVYYEINQDIDNCKAGARKSWNHRSDESGMQLLLGDNQLPIFEQLLPSLSPGRKSTARHDGGDGKAIFIDDAVAVLETMPGWNPAVETGSTYTPANADKSEGVGRRSRGRSSITLTGGGDYEAEHGWFTNLAKMGKEATAAGLWAIDLFLIKGRHRDKPWGSTPMESQKVHIYVAYRKVLFGLQVMRTQLSGSPATVAGIFMFALFRALLPRVWIVVMRGGVFLPDSMCPLVVTLSSCIARFFASFLWLATFSVCLNAYRANVNQVMLISAMVDPRIRLRYTTDVLVDAVQETEEFHKAASDAAASDAAAKKAAAAGVAEQFLARLPLLNLKRGTNVAAFWRIREYVMLDRSNERMAMEVLMEMLIIWLIMNFLVTALTVYLISPLTPLIVITVLDLLVFGTMVISALGAALDVNTLMSNHLRIFVEARYDVTLSLAEAEELHIDQTKGSTTATSAAREDDALIQDLKESRQLLTEYIAMVQEYDTRDKILLGADVTPGSILYTCVSMGAMVGTILYRAHNSGMMADMEEVVAKEGHEALKNIKSHSDIVGKGVKEVVGTVQMLRARAARVHH